MVCPNDDDDDEDASIDLLNEIDSYRRLMKGRWGNKMTIGEIGPNALTMLLLGELDINIAVNEVKGKTIDQFCEFLVEKVNSGH